MGGPVRCLVRCLPRRRQTSADLLDLIRDPTLGSVEPIGFRTPLHRRHHTGTPAYHGRVRGPCPDRPYRPISVSPLLSPGKYRRRHRALSLSYGGIQGCQKSRGTRHRQAEERGQGRGRAARTMRAAQPSRHRFGEVRRLRDATPKNRTSLIGYPSGSHHAAQGAVILRRVPWGE
jgi:hypothetical protein